MTLAQMDFNYVKQSLEKESWRRDAVAIMLCISADPGHRPHKHSLMIPTLLPLFLSLQLVH